MFRTVLFWTHLCVGGLAGLFIFLMSATGLLLTYEHQITEAAIQAGVNPPEEASILTADELITASSAAPNQTLVLYADSDIPPELRQGRSGTRLDPFTGAPLVEAGARTEAFFRAVTFFHRWLSFTGPSDTGGAINAAANLVFVFLILSGMYLWLPPAMKWSMVRARLLLRGGLPTAQARHFNWHHVFGLWALIPLALIASSGVVISYDWANRLVFQAVGEEAPVRRGPPTNVTPGDLDSTAPLDENDTLSMEAILDQAVEQVPNWRSASISLPKLDAPTLRIALDRGNGRQAALRQTITLDRRTGEVLSSSGIEAQSLGSRLRIWFRFIHTGEVYGIVGQTIAGLASAASLILVYTGYSLGIRRLARMWRKRTLAQ